MCFVVNCHFTAAAVPPERETKDGGGGSGRDVGVRGELCQKWMVRWPLDPWRVVRIAVVLGLSTKNARVLCTGNLLPDAV